MSASDKGSGDIDSPSEPSRLDGIPRPAEAGPECPPECCACSNSSLTSFGGITDMVPFLRWLWFWAFTIGDCLTRADDLVDVPLFLFLSFRSGSCTCSPTMSTSKSIGDVVMDVSAV